MMVCNHVVLQSSSVLYSDAMGSDSEIDPFRTANRIEKNAPALA